MNNNVRNDVRLKSNFKVPANIKQPRIIPTIIIPPKNKPDKIIPPGTFVNLINKVVKSPTDKIPNVIFSLWSVVIIAGTLFNWILVQFSIGIYKGYSFEGML